MSAYNLDYDKISKDEYDKVAQLRSDRKASINAIQDSKKTVVTDEYNRDIADTERSYADAYQKNAVQKLINERQIAETNENLGLTDSGLNRTQQTAAQLSYANQKGKLDISKQQTLDQKSGALAAAIAEIEQNRIAALDDNENYWNGIADSNAQAVYKANVDAYQKEQEAIIKANTKLQEAAIKAAASVVPYGAGGTSTGKHILQTSGGLLSRDFGGSLKDNNIDVVLNADGTRTYVDNNSGKKTTFDMYQNPYTGDINSDAYKGVFKNGYQPDNVGGSKLKKVPEVEISVNGNKQSVWYTNGVYYAWNGAENKYESLTRKQIYNLGLA